MGLDVLFIRDVEKIVLAGVVLTIRSAQKQGADACYVAGILAHAEHTCIASKGDWTGLLEEARSILGQDTTILDQALQIGPGKLPD